jgi:hypothetical protein
VRQVLKPGLIILLLLSFSLPLTISSTAQNNSVLWYEDNNLGRAGGISPDFKAMFTTRTEEWQEARKYIKVYLLRLNSLKDPANGIDDTFLKTALIPKLNESHIDLALDVPGISCNGDDEAMQQAATYIDKIKQFGGSVRYVSLQSVLSKPHPQCTTYTDQQRVDNVVTYVQFMHTKYPGIKVGIIDALVAKNEDYKTAYTQLIQTLKQQGLSLDYIHFDFPMEDATANWSNVIEAQQFVQQELHLKMGLILVSTVGGNTSNESFYTRVLSAYKAYSTAAAQKGVAADDIVMMSWHPYPDHNLPEKDMSEYPYMRLVLDLAQSGHFSTEAL